MIWFALPFIRPSSRNLTGSQEPGWLCVSRDRGKVSLHPGRVVNPIQVHSMLKYIRCKFHFSNFPNKLTLVATTKGRHPRYFSRLSKEEAQYKPRKKPPCSLVVIVRAYLFRPLDRHHRGTNCLFVVL